MPRVGAAAWLCAALLAVALSCVKKAEGVGPAEVLASPPVEEAPSASRLGETPWRPFEAWRVERPAAPALDVYVARQDEARRPLLVFVQGSHCLPLFMIGERDGRRREVSTFPLHEAIGAELDRVHFAVVERRGLASFGPPPASEAEAKAAARCTPERGGVSKTERVRDVADAALALSAEPWVDGVILAGHSEGAYVASGAARRLGDRAVRAVALLSGPGPTQFFDFVIEARRRGDLAAVKRVFDELIWITGPTARGDYRGADIERQLSYGVDSTSIDDLRGMSVPIFVANGTEDEKAPIEGADVFAAEMLRERGRAIRYLILPGLDHGYYDAEGRGHMGEVLAALLDWTLSPRKDRSVLLGFPPAAPCGRSVQRCSP